MNTLCHYTRQGREEHVHTGEMACEGNLKFTGLGECGSDRVCPLGLAESSLRSQCAHSGAHTVTDTTEAMVRAVECVCVLLLSETSHGIS